MSIGSANACSNVTIAQNLTRFDFKQCQANLLLKIGCRRLLAQRTSPSLQLVLGQQILDNGSLVDLWVAMGSALQDVLLGFFHFESTVTN